MTTTTAEQRKPILKAIVVRNGFCYLNRKKEFPVPLSHTWKIGDLYRLVPAYADEYELNWISDEHVKTVIDAYMLDRGDGKDNARKEPGDDDKGKSSAELLMELAREKIDKVFKDQTGLAYALVSIAYHREVLPIETGRFKRYLAKLFWDEYQKIVTSEPIKGVSQILQAQAEHEGETFPLNLRVASYMDSFYYDLTDDEWRSVKITKSHWEIETETPILFTRHRALPQVEPDRDYGDVTLMDFVALTNIKDPTHQLLICVYIISLFIPDISHPILNLHGEKGSAKSMLFTLVKLLVDPGKPALHHRGGREH